MSQIDFRQYRGAQDFLLIGNFLIKHFREHNQDGNWFQPTWEYMHTHPYLDESALSRIGIWEVDGEIVGVAHYEWKLGEAFLQFHPHYAHLKPVMLDYAEKNFCKELKDDHKELHVFVNDFDLQLEKEIRERGYVRDPREDRPMAEYRVPDPFPLIRIPDGFRLKSLAEDNDLHKINRVLWRGFNHPGEPPEDEVDGREKMESGQNFKKELKIVIEAADGNFVSFCGMWFEAQNSIAYVEPVATDPDYRRMGLGKAAVLEGIRRCAVLGAKTAFVGSNQLFYQAIGFQQVFSSNCWKKIF